MTQSTTKWIFEPTHCRIGFSVRHFGIAETEGVFKKYDGKIVSEKDDFSDAAVEFSIDVNSIDTLDEARDGHLRSADFFNTEKFPVIDFKSTGIKATGQRKYDMVGDLTMAGITKPVTIGVEFGGIVEKDPFGDTRAGFFVEGMLNRKDWGIIWNRTLDFGGIAVGEVIKIRSNIQLLRAH